jgi:hypothetical protein
MHLLLVPPDELASGVSIDAGPLVILPDDQRAWIASTLGDVDEIVHDAAARSTTGWPVRVVISRTNLRWHVHAFFAFFEHAAIATISGDRREDVEALVGVTLAASPRWTTGIAALVELWDVPPGSGPR